MKYLLYYRDGFLKKFPLEKAEITVGRSSANDLILEEDEVSRRHLQIEVKTDHIVLRDLHSTNGVFVQGRRISVAVIRLGESFSLNGFSFYLREGSLEEFQLSGELDPVFEYMQTDNRSRNNSEETRYVHDVYTEFLKHFLRSGMGKSDFSDFLREISKELAQLPFSGGLFLIIREGEGTVILLAVNRLAYLAEIAQQRIGEAHDVFAERLSNILLKVKAKKEVRMFAFPIDLGKRPASLVYLHPDCEPAADERLLEFIATLARELELLFLVIEDAGRETLKPKAKPEAVPDIPFVAMDPLMLQLVQQANRVARSDLFVTIQGESGTGKELFARLLHDRSHRAQGQYVAINCAAIPETLLESELFGHEKGAFTGAHARRKGKLELASGGTLVLDEIGDMPMGLQVKLLRVLQEHLFYRLGGNEPIRVDLRIISLTNTDLMQAMREGRFRSDLYYRLAHHRFSIPPLRDRRADIPELINFFTRKYCHQTGKSIRGFSIKAFEILQRCSWPGNVRQLENEINRLVNLSDENGLISAELISEEIRTDAFPSQPVTVEVPFHGESERQRLLHLLEQHDWNKSRTAREIGMTYQGLHKKMQRLGIKRPDAVES